MKRCNTITQLSTALLALAAVFACPFAWAQEDTNSYQMSVVFDRAYGDVVSRGNYKGAILRINSKHSRDGYATATNLCVAHTMVGQFKHAEHYCDEALEEAEKAAAKGRRKSRDYDGEWAMAYSNRGVLRARIGDHAGASDDFRLAIEKQPQSELSIHNLAVLNLEQAEPYVQGKKTGGK
jgi:tetratricopeptide (TPR) repeat protein